MTDTTHDEADVVDEVESAFAPRPAVQDYQGHQPDIDEGDAVAFDALLADETTTFDLLEFFNHPAVNFANSALGFEPDEVAFLAETVDHLARHFDIYAYEYVVIEDRVVHKPRRENARFWHDLTMRIIDESAKSMLSSFLRDMLGR